MWNLVHSINEMVYDWIFMRVIRGRWCQTSASALNSATCIRGVREVNSTKSHTKTYESYRWIFNVCYTDFLCIIVFVYETKEKLEKKYVDFL
jgi:hypothetical protein